LQRAQSQRLEPEWAEMSAPRIPMNSDTSEELYAVMRSGKRIKISEASDGIVLSAPIETISDITKLRTKRIALANEKLPIFETCYSGR
jgi:hypothetical protein